MAEPRGYVLWEGPSAINGKDVVAIATMGSSNRKTGDMDQVWFLPRRRKPSSALTTGYDEAICGDCKLRPLFAKGDPNIATCYVSTTNGGPNSVWAAYHRGNYPPVPADFAHPRPVRFGAYGDPASVPTRDLGQMFRRARQGWTAYTHQWRRRPALRRWCMASVDTTAEQKAAEYMGWRTFRVIHSGGPPPYFPAPLQSTVGAETICPAAEHEWNGQSYAIGERSTCAACLLCDGRRENDARRSVAIAAH